MRDRRSKRGEPRCEAGASAGPSSQPKRFGLGASPRSLDRRTGLRDEVARYLIVCEGKATEPNYFDGFRVPMALYRLDIVGAGANTATVVEKAIELRNRAQAREPYDQAWAVFDRDSFTPRRFNRAIELARTSDIRVAHSNEAFELWLLLHYEFCDAALSRKTYKERLTRYLGRPYDKADGRLFDDLLSKQDDAIRNAAKLLARYRPHNPEKDNPSTTVHLLVAELRRHEVQHRVR